MSRRDHQTPGRTHASKQQHRLSRRAVLRGGTLWLAAGAYGAGFVGRSVEAGDTAESSDADNPLRFALVTDLHYADKPPAGSRHYRETLDKFAEAAERFSQQRPDFMVELGDLIDAADSVESELRWLRRIDREFAAACDDRHYVLGNHCVDTLTKEEFLGNVQREKSYYSFDRGGFHFVVLDSCFRSDGEPYGRRNFQWTDPNIPAEQLEWLADDLKKNERKTIVFAHQRLDVSNNYGVNNCEQVRQILERSGQIQAVFQGHSHKNDYHEIGGIHYVTLVAMVEGSGPDSNAYSLASLHDGKIAVEGFRRQESYRWT